MKKIAKILLFLLILNLGSYLLGYFTPEVHAVGPNDYFDTIIARGDFWKGYSLRPRAGSPLGNPYYEKQLLQKNQGGYASCNSCPLDVTYSPNTDTDPNRQDGAKVVIPAFDKTPFAALAADVTTAQTVLNLTAFGSFVLPNMAVKIDNEAMKITAVDRTAQTITVSRGYLGTVVSTHVANSSAYININSLGNAPYLPLGTSDGNTYLFTWDGYWTDSYLNSGLYNHKTFNFLSKSIWLEPNTNFAGGSVAAVRPPGFNSATDVAAYQMRSYNWVGGLSDWSATDGNALGAGVTNNEPILPQLNTFIFKPNRWNRFWILIEQRANDYDYMSGWIADEANDPIKIWDRIPLSVRPTTTPAFTIDNFVLEFNTSTDNYVRGNMRDLVTYVKNFAVLRNPGDVTPLLIRPLSASLPPITPPPPTSTTDMSITATPASITSGSSSTLNYSWNVNTRHNVRLNGAVPTATCDTSTCSGSMVVTPATTTTYTMTAVYADNTTAPSVSATVTVSAATLLVGDLNGDKIINSIDWSVMNSKWFTPDATADLNKDGLVNTIDWSLMNDNWLKTS